MYINRSALFFFFLLITCRLLGQDLIVTEKGDSLNCQISSVESDGIYFKRIVEGKTQRWYAKKDTLIDISRGFFITEGSTGKQKSGKDFQKYRIGLMGGGSLQTGRYTANIYNFTRSGAYLDKLQWGYTIGAEGSYFFTENIGIGLRYHFFHASNFAKDVTLSDPDSVSFSITGDLQDQIYVNFIGPEFILRISSPKHKTRYNTTFAFGLLTYKNKSILKTPATLTGTSVGMNLGFGPEFLLGKNMALGIELSLVMGSITSYKQDDGSKTTTVSLRNRNAISLTRIDLTVGLKWCK